MHVLDTLSFGKIVQIRERLLQAQAAGARVYRFESGDPSFAIAPHVRAAIEKALAEEKTHYVPNNGIPELKSAIRTKLAAKNGIQVMSDDAIFVTNGAMHALFVTFSCLLEPGDEVIVPEPMWTEIVENIRLAGGIAVPVALHAADDYQYCPEVIAQKITPRTKAIFINTPHNPTGAVLERETITAIAALARKHRLYIVSDEAYEDVVFDPYVHHSIAAVAPDLADRIISIFSMSKSHAMPGLRLGYFVASDPVVRERVPKLLRCTINGVNSLSQWGAVAALRGDSGHMESMRREYRRRRDVLCAALEGVPGIRPFRPHGAFYVWAETQASVYERLGCANADEISTYLAERGIGSAPGDAFGAGCANAIRFAFSCDTPMVENGAVALRSALMQR